MFPGSQILGLTSEFFFSEFTRGFAVFPTRLLTLRYLEFEISQSVLGFSWLGLHEVTVNIYIGNRIRWKCLHLCVHS